MNLPFLNPWMLLGLLGAAVPVIIHLLNRHRPKRIEWAAMDLLSRVVRVRSRQIRFQDILLMLLRCLAIILLALALARPTTQIPVADADVGTVIALDVSGSMAHQPAAISRLDRAKDQVRQILSTVKPGSPVTLVAMAASPRVLTRGTGYEPAQFERLLADLAPTGQALNLDRSLSLVQGLAAELQAPQREIYLVTDGQTSSWADLAGRTRAQLAELADTGRVSVVLTDQPGEENLAITELDLASGALRSGEIVRYVATVRNYSPAPREVGSVSLLLNDAVVDRHDIVGELAPGASISVPLYAPLPREGTVRLTARLDPDALEMDNARHASARVRRQIRVLRVQGDPGGVLGATDYLTDALRVGSTGEEASLETQTVSWLGMGDVRFEDFDVVILSNLPDIPNEKAGELYNFVRAGGGLIVLLGDNVDPAMLNRKLRYDGEPLLPARLVATDRGMVGAPLGLPLDPDLPNHPLTRAVRTLAADLITEARFRRVQDVEPLETSRTLMRLAAGGRAVLLERRVGLGSVLLMTTSPDRQWSSMGINPLFPLLIQQSITYLTRSPAEQPITVPGSIVVPADSTEGESGAEITTPDGQVLPAEVVLRDGVRLAQLDQTRRAGFYEIRAAGAPEPMIVAVNPDISESAVAVAGQAELSTVTDGTEASVLTGSDDMTAAIRRGRVGRELWPILLIAGLVVLLIEAAVARRLTRRSTDI